MERRILFVKPVEKDLKLGTFYSSTRRVIQKCDLMVARFMAPLTRGTGICCLIDRRFMGYMLLAQENQKTHSDLMVSQRRDFWNGFHVMYVIKHFQHEAKWQYI